MDPHTFIDGSLPPPFPVHSTYASWYKCDQMLLSWINAMLLESSLPYIGGVTSAKQAWDAFFCHFTFLAPHIMTVKW